jgi:hypothetical protein
MKDNSDAVFDELVGSDTKASELHRETKERIINISVMAARNAYFMGIETGLKQARQEKEPRLPGLVLSFVAGLTLGAYAFVLFVG